MNSYGLPPGGAPGTGGLMPGCWSTPGLGSPFSSPGNPGAAMGPPGNPGSPKPGGPGSPGLGASFPSADSTDFLPDGAGVDAADDLPLLGLPGSLLGSPFSLSNPS